MALGLMLETPPPAAREAAHGEAEMGVVGVGELLPEASLPSDLPESQPLGGQQPAPAWEERLFGVLSAAGGGVVRR